MNTMSKGSRVVTASKTTAKTAMITCYDAATGVSSSIEVSLDVCRKHLAKLFSEGWR